MSFVPAFSDELEKLAVNESWENLKYILEHKYHLYTGGREMDLPRLQLLAHDMSKFRPREFIPYKKFFYGKRTPEVTRKFNESVKKYHYTGNPHHPEHWDKGEDMPMKNKLEMVADWYSAGRTQGTHKFKSFKSWFRGNRDKLNIDEELKKRIEERLRQHA